MKSQYRAKVGLAMTCSQEQIRQELRGSLPNGLLKSSQLHMYLLGCPPPPTEILHCSDEDFATVQNRDQLNKERFADG